MTNTGGYNPPSRLISVKAIGDSKPKGKLLLVTQYDIAVAAGRKTSRSIPTPYKLLAGYIKDFRDRRLHIIRSLHVGTYEPQWVADSYMVWCIKKYFFIFVQRPREEKKRLPSAAQIEACLKLPKVQALFTLERFKNENQRVGN